MGGLSQNTRWAAVGSGDPRRVYAGRVKLGALVGGKASVIGPEATLADAAGALVDQAVGSLGVVDGRKLVGIVTERDLVRAVSEGADPEEETVSHWMSDAPDTFAPAVDVADAAA